MSYIFLDFVQRIGRLSVMLMLAANAFLLYGQPRVNVPTAAQPQNRLQEGMYVPIGGIQQWIVIRGDDRRNPVILFLHGGPGASTLALSGNWISWEKYFTVVQWDQRGTGMTYLKNGDSEAGTLTIPRMTKDGIEVVQFLRSHLHKDKVVLVGFSWGSILGIHMIKQRPELFAAYVGTGQVVNMQQNEELNYVHELAQARLTHNDEALSALRRIGPPPYLDPAVIDTLREWAIKLYAGSGDPAVPRKAPMPGLSPEFSKAWQDGYAFSQQQLGWILGSKEVDLPSLGLNFFVPIFFFEGTADHMTPIELAELYFKQIKAPHKEFVRFYGDHHFIAMNRPIEFLQELLVRVRPLASLTH